MPTLCNNMAMLSRQIIIITLSCIIIVGLPLALSYSYVIQKANAEKIVQMNRYQYMEASNTVARSLSEAKKLAFTAASDFSVRLASSVTDTSVSKDKLMCFKAFESLTNFVYASSVGPYINRLILYNYDGVLLSAESSKVMGHLDDSLLLDEKFSNLVVPYELGIDKALNSNADIISYVIALNDGAYLYMELTLDILSPLINFKNDYIDTVIIYDGALEGLSEEFTGFKGEAVFDSEEMVNDDGNKYLCARFSMDDASFSILSILDYSSLISSTYFIYYDSIFIIIVSLVVATILAFYLSRRITKPVRRLVEHINNTDPNKFVIDESIERGNDEFALIGKTINNMNREIEASLQRKEEFYKEQVRNEIALLQSQVNPHFLYNTLESIRLMAVIQKNKGIERMTRSLVALLKDLSKGTDDIYQLGRELELLDNYVEIQKIRYLDSFEFIDNIPVELHGLSIIKFTLQPIVENAIIHGIDPGRGNGIIVLEGRTEGDMLVIDVIDNGSGMDEATAQSLLLKETKGKMTGIGIYNVNRRIKLVFGEKYGLDIESIEGKGTKVSIRLPKREYV